MCNGEGEGGGDILYSSSFPLSLSPFIAPLVKRNTRAAAATMRSLALCADIRKEGEMCQMRMQEGGQHVLVHELQGVMHVM